MTRDGCLAALAALRSLAAGWLDSDGATIDPRALATARTCVDLLAAIGEKMPYIYPTPDGGVQLERDIEERDDVRIEPDGKIVVNA